MVLLSLYSPVVFNIFSNICKKIMTMIVWLYILNIIIMKYKASFSPDSFS